MTTDRLTIPHLLRPPHFHILEGYELKEASFSFTYLLAKLLSDFVYCILLSRATKYRIKSVFLHIVSFIWSRVAA
jgi:hypothetical protein